MFLHASVTSLAPHSLTLDRAFPEVGVAESDRTLRFDFLIYALGSHLPAPIDLWGPVADEDEDEDEDVLVVGGGALGIRESLPIVVYFFASRLCLCRARGRPVRRSARLPICIFFPLCSFVVFWYILPLYASLLALLAVSGRVGGCGVQPLSRERPACLFPY